MTARKKMEHGEVGQIASTISKMERVRSDRFVRLFANDFTAFSDENSVTLIVSQITPGTYYQEQVEEGTSPIIHEDASIVIPWGKVKMLSDALTDLLKDHMDSLNKAQQTPSQSK